MFNPRRLRLARGRRRFTAKALAEKADVAAETISRLETGGNPPDDATIQRLAKALRFPVSFFHDDEPEDIDTGAVSFRSFSKMSAKERDAAISAGCLGLQLSKWVEARFNLPRPNLLDLSHETDPWAAAQAMRQYWGLGERPIGNMLGLLETNGIRVFSLSENTASVNAFSFWRDDKPYVFLNNFKTAESSIFDTAHEMCHLTMHKHGDPKGIRSAEREADAFASAFLMPANDVKARIPRPITVDVVLEAKARWRVSAFAMVLRLHTLKLVSEWNYRSLCIELSKRGYRSGEPIGIERETSLIWKKVLTQLWAERTTKASIANELHLPLDELEGLIWNLAGVNERPDPQRGSVPRLV
jgi:Zn-dependent peptidase ImmA (M78 family)/transcriptional regulator with XRE-family HTH domain